MTRKRSQLVFVVLTLLCVSVVNQSCLLGLTMMATQDIKKHHKASSGKNYVNKCIQESVNQGYQNSRYHFYVIENKEGKQVNVGEARECVEKQGYYFFWETHPDRDPFKWTVAFINPKEFKDAEDMSFIVTSGHPKSDFTKKGTCFLIKDSKRRQLKELLHENAVLNRYDGVLWTGEVKDGLLHGSGSGILNNSENNYVTIIGTFDHGLPTGEVVIQTLNLESGKPVSCSADRGMYLNNRPVIADHEVCARHLKSNDSVLIKAIGHRMKAFYDEDAKNVEKIYAEAKTLNISNYTSFDPKDEYINSLQLFNQVYDINKYDPNNELPKVLEILDVYRISVGTQKEIQTYYGFNGWSVLTQNYNWFDDKVKDDRYIFSECLESARRLKDSSKYGFQNIGIDAYPKLIKKYADFEKKVVSDYDEYSRKFDKIAQQHMESEEKLSHEINWDNAMEPSGKLVNMSMFSSYKTYEKDGRIYTKSGRDYCTYNIIYDPQNRVDCYRILYSSKQVDKKDFKSLGELVEYFLKAIE